MWFQSSSSGQGRAGERREGNFGGVGAVRMGEQNAQLLALVRLSQVLLGSVLETCLSASLREEKQQSKAKQKTKTKSGTLETVERF